MISDRNSFFLAVIALMLAWGVIMLGAYTRLKDAGLGCPDWPGCYGQLVVPSNTQQLQHAAEHYPQQPVVAEKAWAEMGHRYAAGSLGGLILILAVRAVWRRCRQSTEQPLMLPLLLVGLVVFQAALGMWTVTLQLFPLVVMGHLLGGMAIFTLLGLLVLQLKKTTVPIPSSDRKAFRKWALLSLFVVIIQIALGGWTSANYAALVCTDFPFCQGVLIPDLDFAQAFQLWHAIGPNYQGGLLSDVARMTIQFTHRAGGLITLLIVGGLVINLMARAQSKTLRMMGVVILIVLLTQISLGVLNLWLLLPLLNAVAHNGIAALLLLTVAALNYRLLFSGDAHE